MEQEVSAFQRAARKKPLTGGDIIFQILIFLVVSQPCFLATANSYLDIVPLSDGRVLFVDDNCFRTVSDSSDEIEEWAPSWDYLSDGWVGTGTICCLSGSADGGHVCYAIAVNPGKGIGGPLAVVVCEADGSGARPVALSYDVGGGPQFEFTMDSDCIYGSPILGCYSDSCCYLDRNEYLRSRSCGLDPLHVDMIDLATGEAVYHNVCQDYGFLPCPWSDLVSNGGDPAFRIYDVVNCRTLFELQERYSYPVISNWVLPDAGLARTEDGQILRFADGTEICNPGERLSVYARLDDDRYLFSFDHGNTVLLGNMDWENFQGVDPILQPDLCGRSLDNCCVAFQEDLLYFRQHDSLFVYPLVLE